MTTSQITSLSSDNEKKIGVISENTLAYFQERFRNRLYDLVLGEFQKQQRETGLTQAQLAERIGKDTSRINKWLRTPGNWTLDTISDLLLGVCTSELGLFVSPLAKPLPTGTGALWMNWDFFPIMEMCLPAPEINCGLFGSNAAAALHATTVDGFDSLNQNIRSPLLGYYLQNDIETDHSMENGE